MSANRQPATPDVASMGGVEPIDGVTLAARLDADGVAVVPGLLGDDECADVRSWFDDDTRFRSTVVMARHGYGRGTYRYFSYPLPPLVQRLRTGLYPPLAAVANGWARRLGEPAAWPHTHDELRARCAAAGQRRPTPLVLRYGPGDHNCLHQDVYGELNFPLQVAILLDRPDVDFTGGENVFVEQRPRAQSRPIVVRPERGDGIVFAVRHRPAAGTRGDRRVQLRHGVSTVTSGRRHALGIIFHDAT
jgi:hypothetical protein